jgi:hypothetical protein
MGGDGHADGRGDMLLMASICSPSDFGQWRTGRMSVSSRAMRTSRRAWAWRFAGAAPPAKWPNIERGEAELSLRIGSLRPVKEIRMKNRQVRVWRSVAIQQDVFRATPPGDSENNLEVPRDVDDAVFGCIHKPAVSRSASGQLARDEMTRIAECVIVKLAVEPSPCFGRQVTAGNIERLAHHGAAPGAPLATLIEFGLQSAG